MARLLRENVAFTAPTWDMVTLTPPGADELPWDTARCTHRPGLPCSGSRGCRIDYEAAAAWHASFADRLDALLRAAKAALYRAGLRVPPIIRVVELQERGALHVHLAAPVAHRSAFHRLFCELQRLTAKPKYGFGQRVSWDPARGQDRGQERGLGAYINKLARYVSKEAAGSAGGLREVLRAMPGRRIFSVSLKITGETRCTMRNLRSLRYLHMRGWRDRLEDPSHLCCASVEQLMEIDRQEQLLEVRELVAERGPPWVPAWRDPLVIALGRAGVDVVALSDAA